jgi:transcriptional regulator with XRE-family HTH domain
VDAEWIGAEIRKLREVNRLSQEELGHMTGLSRPAVAMIESGKRKVSAIELLELARVFNLSLDQFVHPERRPEGWVDDGDLVVAETSSSPRISIPRDAMDKFREVLLYLLGRIGALPHVGETVLYKLLYFIDFNYYEKYEEQLIGATYIRNHYGPTPLHFRNLVEEMESNATLEKVASDHYGYPQTKYLPLREPDLSVLSARELEAIDEVLCGPLGRMNAKQISEYSHHDVPWMIAEEGKALDYEAVFYRTPPYSVRDYPEENGD